ncbi:peptidyl-prolyl cis-trans isomerase [Marinomonas agarivorans]|nr:peptidyl-prolyl cis-trans isomerase [Marinomonas agarivorans]
MKHLILIACCFFAMHIHATQVSIITNLGDIEVQLYEEQAPLTVKNFLSYVDEGFYKETIFHRVIPGFMAQGGGFTKDMERKATKKPVPYEGKSSLSNDRGTLAMARTSDPNSATSQFFINYVNNIHLNHGSRAGYAVFGKVTKGMDIVEAMAAEETGNVGPYRNVPLTPIVIQDIIRLP